MTNCPDCGGAVTRGHDTFEVRIGRRTVTVPGEYERCRGECGEFYLAPGEMDAVMKRASAMIRAEEGMLIPAEIKAFRKGIGLTQPQLEDLLGAGPKTVGRWEKGTIIQNGATDTLLRLLRDVPAALQHLLAERGIVPDVVPLVPVPRPVSYQYRVTADSAPVVRETLAVYASEAQDLEVAIPVQRAERIA
ncbi:MAG: putative transcriptional regulator [Gemmatimonadetes bacterium]|nr:putative transcriptional regulator [Gemmatimonadota bacterium]